MPTVTTVNVLDALVPRFPASSDCSAIAVYWPGASADVASTDQRRRPRSS